MSDDTGVFVSLFAGFILIMFTAWGTVFVLPAIALAIASGYPAKMSVKEDWRVRRARRFYV
jgi:uncharacterized membrane protein